MELDYLVVSICGTCLVALIFALIFSSSFRKEISAEPGKVSMLGVSVEGVVIVLLIALLSCSLAYALNKYSDRKRYEANQSLPSVRLSELPFAVNDKEDALKKITNLMRESEAIKKNDVVAMVRLLEYDRPESEEIRSFQSQNIGPWKASSAAKETFLTIPSKIKKGEAFGCPKQLNKTFEIRARLDHDDGTIGEAVIVTVTDVITQAEDCEKIFNMFQVSCDIAARVLTDQVVRCDKNNQPKWNVNNKINPIWLTRVKGS